MYETFTERARKVCSLARQHAQHYTSEFVGTEHLLLGIMTLKAGPGHRILELLGVDEKMLRQELEKILAPSASPTITLGQLPFSPRAKHCIEVAELKAKEEKIDTVGTEHLLWGLVLDSEGVACQVLQNLGISLKTFTDCYYNYTRREATPAAAPVDVRIAKMTVRYGERENGLLTHHGDCGIYAFYVCTCGLLHDLLPLETEKRTAIYPEFADELGVQDRTLDRLKGGR